MHHRNYVTDESNVRLRAKHLFWCVCGGAWVGEGERGFSIS